MSYLLRLFLFPIAIIYDAVTRFRNYLYDKQYKKSYSPKIPTINVGNLTVGGTGKTPHVEYLIRLLKPHYNIATLSRGYGRKTKGFIMADDTATAEQIADEPMQFWAKFAKDITVAVGEKRVNAIDEILSRKPTTNIILLDDAFQHRSVKAPLNILLTDHARPFYNDYLLPSGRLRENRQGAKRADIVIVTKCPDNLTMENKESIKKSISPYIKPTTPVFFTGIRYLAPQPIFTSYKEKIIPNVLLLTGIANSQTLVEKVREKYVLLKHIELKDHYHYTEQALKKIIEEFFKLSSPSKCILTTEKDMVKLRNPSFAHVLKDMPLFYIPIEIYFQEQEEDCFNEIIIKTIGKSFS